MLFHLSIDAERPQHVAEVLAEILGGRATPFPPVAEGSWVAHAGDDRNTLIEVYPLGTALLEGPGGAVGVTANFARRHPVHFAIATFMTEDQVHAIAAREEWPCETHSRGGKFRVIEVWLEGRTLAEVLTPAMQAEYLHSVRLDRWLGMLESGAPPAVEQRLPEPVSA